MTTATTTTPRLPLDAEIPPEPKKATTAQEPANDPPFADPPEPGLKVEVLEDGANLPAVASSRPTTAADMGEEITAANLARIEHGVDLFERYTKALERIYYAALRRTRPQDWVLTRAEGDGEEVVMAMFCATGYPAIAEVYGIGPARGANGQPLPMFGPLNDRGEWAPERVAGKTTGTYGYQGWARAYCRFNGREELVIATRWNFEDFTGRTIDAETGLIVPRGDVALDSDLRGALLSLLKKKVIAGLAGIARVPGEDLEAAWDGTTKKVTKCRKGHGFGSSAERKARGAASAGIDVERALLREEIVAVTGGDHSAGSDLVKQITAWTDKKGEARCFNSIDKLTRDFQFRQAWDALRAHPVFGRAVRSPAEVQDRRQELIEAGASGGGEA